MISYTLFIVLIKIIKLADESRKDSNFFSVIILYLLGTVIFALELLVSVIPVIFLFKLSSSKSLNNYSKNLLRNLKINNAEVDCVTGGKHLIDNIDDKIIIINVSLLNSLTLTNPITNRMVVRKIIEWYFLNKKSSIEILL